MAENLWGEIPTGENLRTPHSILLDQANILTEQTKGLLVGHVGRGNTSRGTFTSSLAIVAPSLNNYSYTVLHIQHNIALYPVTMFLDASGVELANEAAFIERLGQVLKSEPVKRV